MAKILIITDTPIEREINTSNYGLVETMSTRIDIMYVGLEDVYEGRVGKIKGHRADLVLVPKTLVDMPEIYKPLRETLIGVTVGDSSKIIHYENTY